MRYELYLRMPEFAERPELSAFLAALSEGGFAGVDQLPAQLDLGKGQLLAEAFVREETAATEPPQAGPEGLNLSFPMGLDAAEGDRAVSTIFAVAQALGATVFDPQLGQTVSQADQDQILRAWKRSYEFQAGIAGTVDMGSGSPGPVYEPPGIGGQIKYFLILGLVVIVAAFLFRSCFSGWMEEQFDAPAPVADEEPAKPSP